METSSELSRILKPGRFPIIFILAGFFHKTDEFYTRDKLLSPRNCTGGASSVHFMIKGTPAARLANDDDPDELVGAFQPLGYWLDITKRIPFPDLSVYYKSLLRLSLLLTMPLSINRIIHEKPKRQEKISA